MTADTTHATDGSAPPTPGWRAGDALSPLTVGPVTRLDLIKYAGASGDYNPIHTIDQAAAEAGLRGVIQHGMLTMAELGRLFSPYLAAGYVRRFEARFVGMVHVGDTLTLDGACTGVEPRDDGTDYLFEVRAADGEGHAVATGRVTFHVPTASDTSV